MGQQEVHPGLGLLVAPDQNPQHRLEKYWFRCNFTLTGLIASLVKSVVFGVILLSLRNLKEPIRSAD